MNEFNWDAYGRWETKMEWQNGPHEEDCSCRYCSIHREWQTDPEHDD